MEPSQSKQARPWLLSSTAVLVGLVILSQPITTDAADGKGETDTTGVAMPGPVRNTGLREPSSGGSLVLRGTRPISPASTQAPNVGNQAPPSYGSWRPVQPVGAGWSTDYDWGGMSYTPTPGG